MRSLMLSFVLVLPLGAGLGGCATSNVEAENLGFAAATPLRDLNIANPPIPGQLQSLSEPYGRAGPETCAAWRQEVEQLHRALAANEGRRVGFRRSANTLEGRTGNLRDVGVAAAATSFIPLRGLVRQVSGAAQLEQQALLASDRARFRIGYLVGTARAAGCPSFQARPRLGPVHIDGVDFDRYERVLD